MTTNDAIAEFNEAVKAKMQAGMDSRAAKAAVAKLNPALHEQYLLATNPGRESLVKEGAQLAKQQRERRRR